MRPTIGCRAHLKSELSDVEAENGKMTRSSTATRASEAARVAASLHDGVPRTDRPQWTPLVNWRGANEVPLHRWFRYREGYSPALTDALSLGQRVLDPFCGSGSIMVGAAQTGRSSVGIDVNPLATFVARVKLSPLSRSQVCAAEAFRACFDDRVQACPQWPAPELRIVDKLFEPEVLAAMLRARWLIEEQQDRGVRDFLLVGWLNVLELVGSYFKEGNGIKYRNRKRLRTGYVARPDGAWQLERFGADQAAFARRTLRRQLDLMLADAHDAWGIGAWDDQEVHDGSCLDVLPNLPPSSFDDVVFSPPYANRFDYVESMKVELWFGGFVQNYADATALRKQSLRSHLGADLGRQHTRIEELEQFINLMDPDAYHVRMRVPELLRGYFDDMAAVLRACRAASTGATYVVVGNSAYAGVIVPTDVLLARLGLEVGYTRAVVHTVRHLGVAPQQRDQLAGMRELMRESVVELR
jgi:hypothetical protein